MSLINKILFEGRDLDWEEGMERDNLNPIFVFSKELSGGFIACKTVLQTLQDNRTMLVKHRKKGQLDELKK